MIQNIKKIVVLFIIFRFYILKLNLNNFEISTCFYMNFLNIWIFGFYECFSIKPKRLRNCS